jgi:hypothetical protein
MTTIFNNNGHIANSRFEWKAKPGTGNKSCKVSDAEKLRLTNILIDHEGVNEFLNILYQHGEKKMSIELSERRCSRRYGTAWYIERRVALYRHTVWVFLHEIAHILDVNKSFATGIQIRPAKPHGPIFGRHLTCLYNLWMEYCDKGVENLPQTQDAPNGDVDIPITKKEYEGLKDAMKWKVPERRPRIVGGISLQVGTKVWFATKKRGVIHGIVKKVNIKTCRVTPLDGSNDWKVSPKLLNKD